MNLCNKCFENYWRFDKTDDEILAACQMCGNEIGFPMKKKALIKNVGDLCRRCKTLVVYKEHQPNFRPKKQNYYYKAWLKCPNCKNQYMLESEKVILKTNGNTNNLH